MKVIVKSYKPSGKWYHTEETQIELQTIDDVLDLEEKIKCNDESIQYLSGLKQGFSQYFTYMIELKSDNLFMDFIIHSNEFIRSPEVFSEKEKNEKLEECNHTLFKAIEEVNRINKKLDTENKKLKKAYCEFKNYCTCNTEKFLQTFAEIKKVTEPYKMTIKKICGNCKKYDDCHACCYKDINCYKYTSADTNACKEFTYLDEFVPNILANNILQKISECEVDNA